MNRTDIRFLGLEVYVYDSSLDVELPMPTNVVKNVDWGDGTIDSFAIGTSATHTYATTEPTTFRLKIYPNADGTLPLFNGTLKNSKQSIANLMTSIRKVYNCNAPFSSVAWDFQNMTNCTYMDWRILSYSDYINGNPFNNSANIANLVPNHTLEHLRGDVRYIFTNMSKLKGSFPSVPKGVTNITGLFSYSGLGGVASGLPEGIVNMASAFAGSKITGLSSFPSTVTSLNGTFSNCTALTWLPSVPNGVTDMGGMCWGCTTLATFPNIPDSITGNLNYVFCNCRTANGTVTIPASCSGLFQAFKNCQSWTGNLPSIPSVCIDITECFSGCSKVTGSTPALHENIGYCNSAFHNCSHLDGTIGTIDPAITAEFKRTFFGCSSLTGNAPALWDTTLYPNVTQPDPGNSNQCFYGCTSLSNYADIPADWK